MFYSLTDYRFASSTYIPYTAPSKLSQVASLTFEKGKKKGLPKGVFFPLIVDTEFKSTPTDFTKQLSRERLTIQVKPFNEPLTNAVIYDDWDSIIDVNQRRHQVPTYDDIIKTSIAKYSDTLVKFHPVHTFEDGKKTNVNDLEVELTSTSIDIDDYSNLPRFVTMIYAHFATAELMHLARKGSSTYQVLRKTLAGQAFLYKDDDGFVCNELDTKRRLTASIINDDEKRLEGHLDLFTAVEIDGQLFRLTLNFIDTSSWGSYESLLKAGNLSTDNKVLFTRGEGGEIERMDEMYLERPNDFDTYSINDLRIDEALININRFYQDYLIENEIPDTTTDGRPVLRRLTDGSHVSFLFECFLRKSFPAVMENVDLRSTLESGTNPKLPVILGNSNYYARIQNSKTAKLSKVIGGRCRNNKPLTSYYEGHLCDIDISGCYGDGMRVQQYPIGRPFVQELNMTLRKFLKKYEGELEYGLWFCTVSGVLEYGQDLIQSFFDTDEIEGEDDEVFDVRKGRSKIFSNEVVNGVLTSDYIDVIRNSLGEKAKADMLDNLIVTAFTGHFKKDRFHDEESFLNAFQTHVDDHGLTSRTGNRNPDNECFYGWISQSLGDMIIDGFIETRKNAQRIHGKKSAQDLAAKLNVNTTYGVLASRFFSIGNVIAANNITARARVLVWMMEKSFNSFHSITDGGVFDLNKIIHPRRNRSIPFNETVYEYHPALSKKQMYQRGSLLDSPVLEITYDEIKNEEGTFLSANLHTKDRIYKGYEALTLVNKTAWNVLQTYFPRHPITTYESTSLSVDNAGKRVYKPRKGLFEFEVKQFYTKGVFHGASNYQLFTNEWENPKYRSYENKKRYHSIHDNDVYFAFNNPAKKFFNELAVNASSIDVQPPFVKTGIIKTSDYKQKIKQFNRTGLNVGDTVLISGMFRPLSLSQFLFKNVEQYKKVDKQVQKMKTKDGWSYERFFLNDDQTINYEMMIKTVEKMIREGDDDITKHLSLSVRRIRITKRLKHPFNDVLIFLTDALQGKLSANDKDASLYNRCA